MGPYTWASLSVILLVVSGSYCECLENKSEIQAYGNTEDGIAESPVSHNSIHEPPKRIVKRAVFATIFSIVMGVLSVPGIILSTADLVKRISNANIGGDDYDVAAVIDRAALGLHQEFTRRFEQLEARIQGIQDTLEELLRGLPYLLNSREEASTLKTYMSRINTHYARYEMLGDHNEEARNYTRQWIDFANKVAGFDDDSVLNTLIYIHNMVAPDYPLPKELLWSTDTKNGSDLHQVNGRTKQVLNKFADKLFAKTGHSKRKIVKKPDVYRDLELIFNQGFAKNTSSGRFTKKNNAKFSVKKHSVTSSPIRRGGTLKVLEQAAKHYSCFLDQSSQQMLFEVFIHVHFTYGRGLVMIVKAYDILTKSGLGSFETEKARKIYDHFIDSLKKTALRFTSRASTSFSRCDPANHKLGETYEMFTELLQGNIEGDWFLNQRFHEQGVHEQVSNELRLLLMLVEVCKPCANFTTVPNLHDWSMWGRGKGCRGTLHDCQEIHRKPTICVSRNPHRRFDSIRYGNGVIHGSQGACENESIVELDSGTVFCRHCACLCDGSSSEITDRFISLMPIETDVNNGMVLTGVKFTKHQRMIMMQVEQGRALPQGQVEPSSRQWMPLRNVNMRSEVDGVHYHTLTYEARTMNLDDLTAPADHVITGTRFQVDHSSPYLQIRVTPINYTNGSLRPEDSFWVKSNSKKTTRKKIILHKPDDPTKLQIPSRVVSRGGTYVEFQATDMESDVSQMTVPYFDAQPVTTSTPTWITGLSLYHKGRDFSGGFIGFQIQTFNFSRVLEEAIGKLDS